MGDKTDELDIIKIPKSRMFDKRCDEVSNKRINNQLMSKWIKKPSDVSLRKLSLNGNKPLQIDFLQRDEVLLPYKSYIKKQEKERRQKGLAINMYEKYKIINTELRARLHVDSLLDDVHAVINVDEDTYSSVNYRSLIDRTCAYKSLRCYFSSQLRMREEVGYRYDNILNILIYQRKLLEIYDRSTNKLIEQAKYFDEFISNDYQKSRACLVKCEELRIKIDAKTIELENEVVKNFRLKSRLIRLDYMYGIQQRYGRFLYYLSPTMWRAQNRDFAKSVEIEAKGFDYGLSDDRDTFEQIFEKLQQECCGRLVQPALYFTDHNDMMEIFNGIEELALHNFIHILNKKLTARTWNEGLTSFKEIISKEYAAVANKIKSFETILMTYEDRSLMLESKFFKLVSGPFYKSVGAPEILKLKLCLEFCFEKLYFNKSVNLDIMTCAKALENFYIDYSQKIDTIQSSFVKKAEIQCFEYNRRNLGQTKNVDREMHQIHILERNLRRACAPIIENQSPVLPAIIKPNKHKKVKHSYSKTHLERQELTGAEEEYLSLFTDWSENDDPAKYMQTWRSRGNSETNATQKSICATSHIATDRSVRLPDIAQRRAM